MSLKNILNNLPNQPGIYLFYNFNSELIYVGKATSLKNRVKSYFKNNFILSEPKRGESKDPAAKGTNHGILRHSVPQDKLFASRPIESMIHEVKKIKTLKTDSVLEAIILESDYIKKYHPKYNIKDRDDKSWNYLYLTKEPFPKLKTIRQHEIHNSKFIIHNSIFFGPFPSLNTHETLKLLHKLFYISRCAPNQPKPCFDYQLGQCLGVCTGEITPQVYKQKVIKPLIEFLKGNKKRLLSNLKKQMLLSSKQQNFEEAARLRNQIKSLQHIQDVTLLNKDLFNNFHQPTAPPTYRPSRIEAYDISNLGSTGKVGSMVVFNNNGPVKSEYRKFKIKTVSGQSDVDCLKEIIERRLKNSWPIPDLIIVDGGVPQRNAVLKILNLKSIFLTLGVIGIAKGPTRKKNEFIFDKNNKKIADFIQANENLLIRARDEAHRFAISYQKNLRKIN